MQDRLKFRVWSKRECKYVEYHLDDDLTFAIDIDGKLIAYASDYSDHANCDNGDFDDSHMVEQCTGLKDKNDKLIYEGDIVAPVRYDGSMGSKAVVKYGEFNCSCCDGVYGWYFDNGDIRGVEYYEVIGNIHENADLLENKDE
jgi:uncharacterized phage protein (TIGR01671 family)